MIVLDTSTLVDFLVGADERAELVRTRVADERIAVPHAADLECASALRGLVLGRQLSADEAYRALQLLTRMRLRRYGHLMLLDRIWDLRRNAWPYDAAYVALAERLGVPLVTIDAKLQGIPDTRCPIEVLSG